MPPFNFSITCNQVSGWNRKPLTVIRMGLFEFGSEHSIVNK